MSESDYQASDKNLTVGIICQPMLSDLLAPLYKAVIYQQMNKLIKLVGQDRLIILCSLNGLGAEIGVVTALELDLKIKLLPVEKIAIEDPEQYLKCYEYHNQLTKQSNVISEKLPSSYSNTRDKIIEASDVLIMAYDQQNSQQSEKFKEFEEQYFDTSNYIFKSSRPTEGIPEIRLYIRINVPSSWDKYADEMVNFEYMARRSINEKPMTEIDIPSHIVDHWHEALLAVRH